MTPYPEIRKSVATRSALPSGVTGKGAEMPPYFNLLLEEIKSLVDQANAKSQSEFVSDAIRFYIGYLQEYSPMGNLHEESG